MSQCRFPLALIMYVSLFLSSVVLTIFQEFASANCPNSAGVYDSVTGRCFYVGEKVEGKSTVEKKCSDLDTILKSGHQWYLPKLDSVDKNDKTAAIVSKHHNSSIWKLWVGLVRDAATNEGKNLSVVQWEDSTKWRWIDGTTLADSYPVSSSKPPWNPGEPNNNKIMPVAERCVMLSSSATKAKWDDYPCDSNEGTLIVCEANAVVTTTTTTTTTTPTTTTTTTTGKKTTTIPFVISETSSTTPTTTAVKPAQQKPTDKPTTFPFIVVYVSVGIAVVCIAFMIGVCLVRRRKKKEKNLLWLQQSRTDMGSNISGATSSATSGVVTITSKKSSFVRTTNAGISKKAAPTSKSPGAEASKKTSSLPKSATPAVVGVPKRESKSLLKKTSEVKKTSMLKKTLSLKK